MQIDEIKKKEEVDRFQDRKVEAYKPPAQYQNNTVNATKKNDYQQAVAAVNPKDTYNGAQTKAVAGKEELAVAHVMLSKGKSDMKPEALAQELTAQGYNVRAQGKELHFLDGNGNVVKTIRDTDGDGNIGMKDKEFRAAIEQLAGAHPELNQLLQMHEMKKAQKNGEYGLAAGYGGIINQAAANFGQGGANDINQMLAPVQAQLDALNYTDKTAMQLYEAKELPPVAAELGIQVPPNLPEPGINPYQKTLELFKMALVPYIPYMMG